jgi:hypothetical protein
MSAIVVGDYVKVEYQGTVTHIDGDAARLEHKGYVHWMPYEDLVPAAKPVAVGDKVTADNIGQLGEYATVQAAGGLVAQRIEDGYQDEPWHTSLGTTVNDACVLAWPATVIALGKPA